VGCILAVCIEGGEACEGAPTSPSFRRKHSVETVVTTFVLLEGGEGGKGSDTAAWGVARGVVTSHLAAVTTVHVAVKGDH
jgi:hypothetical protein